jgi:hypothetical protein
MNDNTMRDDVTVILAPTWALGRTWLCACPFCGGFHWHGAPPGDRLPTHRLSHCLDNRRGYMLMPATSAPPSTIEIERRRHRASRRRKSRNDPVSGGAGKLLPSVAEHSHREIKG